MAKNKWSKGYWQDLGERVGATLVGALITLLTSTQITNVSVELGWTIVGLPTVFALLKGLLANMKDSDSGASLVNHPPGPEVQ